ncbi:hypothetical protein N7466_007212 [Penicillium verhagenii]|uniref:uncharacterized protein n=1 Tax=Penicillium verhagenii TaxID=1562060 RepID=UPI0025455877|nr:uncharacterized protein N7466_007212 [Penicillium verhagenii]KAJ5928256.1 hypothetical protein N7466_007212 [Penicillium verhagenii]
MTSDLYHGLTWTENIFGLEPRWTYEPEISAIERTLQSLYPSHAIQVSYLTEGTFNKIYRVKLDDEFLILRVSLPVEPIRKTQSEVATMKWIQRVTEIPTPRIIAYDATRDSEIGFEWILMTEIHGKPLADHWRQLDIPAKSKLTRKFAEFSVSLWRNQLKGIGNLYSSATTDGKSALAEQTVPSETSEGLENEGTQTGQVVSLDFFSGSHGRQNVPRGPFSCTKDWIDVCLALSRNDYQQILDEYAGREDLDNDTKEDIEVAEKMLKVIEGLENIFPIVFPVDTEVAEPSVIFHEDLSLYNIMVDDKGDLAGVLDWEFVSAMPLWKTCYYPKFLLGQPRHTKPDIEDYDSGNPQPRTAYWEHLDEYEATILRDVSMEEIRRLDPGWADLFDASDLKRDYGAAVGFLNCWLGRRQIRLWVEEVASGNKNPHSLCAQLGC